jgi:hypothetical protein
LELFYANPFFKFPVLQYVRQIILKRKPEFTQGRKIFPSLLMLFFALIFSAAGQQPLQINLQPEPLGWTPAGYHFAGATDERENRGPIGKILTQGRSVPALFQDSPEYALETFAKKSVQKDQNQRPVYIRLVDLEISERENENGIVEGQVNLHFAFDLLRNDVFSHLVDYQGGVSYRRSGHRTDLVEPALRRAVSAGLKYFNDWMQKEAFRNIKLVEHLQLKIQDYPVKESGDTVFYASDRPLAWDDFKDKPRIGSPYAAAIFPSFALEGDSELIDGQVHLQMDLKVYMLKDASWVAADAKDVYGLNHEQRHFDLVKIVAERFRKRLLEMDLDPEDYNSEINYQYLEAYREMNRIQAAYDEATAHGRNKNAQARWNRLIDEIIAHKDWARLDKILNPEQ